MEEEKDKQLSDNKYLEKQILIVLGIALLFLIVGFLVLFNQTESNRVNAIGLIWEKEMYGSISFYVANVQGYSFDGQPINFKTNLRNDPRKLRKIPIEGGELNLVKNKPTYISLDFESGIEKCGHLALVHLGIFSANLRLNFETAAINEEIAIENKLPYITCENSPDNSVFILKTGDESKIQKISENCYHLIVNECEIIEVIERFEIEILSKLTGKSL